MVRLALCVADPTTISGNHKQTDESPLRSRRNQPAIAAISATTSATHEGAFIREYEGRGPGTKSEELSVKYLTEQFQKLGLKPGNPDGTYVQKVPLAGFTAQPTASFTAGTKTINLDFPKDYVAVSRRFVPESKVENSDVVFVGYGVVAPEYAGRYKGVEWRGKDYRQLITIRRADASDPSKLEKMFKAKP